MQKIKLYTIGLALLAVAFGTGLILLTNAVAPDRLGNVLFFYFLSAGFAFCLSTLGAFFIRKAFGQRELLNLYIRLSMREGLWLAIMLSVSLLLLHRQLFSWLNATLLVLAFVFLESYLLTKNE